jgi:hypothetical protein
MFGLTPLALLQVLEIHTVMYGTMFRESYRHDLTRRERSVQVTDSSNLYTLLLAYLKDIHKTETQLVIYSVIHKFITHNYRYSKHDSPALCK